MTEAPHTTHTTARPARSSSSHRTSAVTDATVASSAIAYGLGMIDAQVGRDAVGRWAAVLDEDPLQQVNAFYLRRALCLHRGDMQSAERFRRKAEVLAVQANIRQMFATVSVVELSIAAMMRDLTLDNAIRAIREVSHDVTGRRKVRLASGREMSALDIQPPPTDPKSATT